MPASAADSGMQGNSDEARESVMPRRIAVITGACGGMGMACSRALGQHNDLVLLARNPERLLQEVTDLAAEGCRVVAALAGDIADSDYVAGAAAKIAELGRFGALVHTAGISPIQGDPEQILRTNTLSTALLFSHFLNQAEEGSVAIVISSIAGHFPPQDIAVDGISDTADPEQWVLAALSKINERASEGIGRAATTMAYAISKWAVNDMCERRVNLWAAKGARILSLSPGIIWTNMGKTAHEQDAAARAAFEGVAMKRWGRVEEIAGVVEFLCSERASFITGCDLLVDGGFTANAKQRA